MPPPSFGQVFLCLAVAVGVGALIRYNAAMSQMSHSPARRL